jgi:uncharacterized protein (DUF433 family)
MSSTDCVVKNPNILSGTPVFRGTRVPLQLLFDSLERGHTLEQFLEGYPTVSRENLERRKIAIIIFVGSRSLWKTSCPSFRIALPNSKRSSPAKSSESVVSDRYPGQSEDKAKIVFAFSSP